MNKTVAILKTQEYSAVFFYAFLNHNPAERERKSTINFNFQSYFFSVSRILLHKPKRRDKYGV